MANKLDQESLIKVSGGVKDDHDTLEKYRAIKSFYNEFKQKLTGIDSGYDYNRACEHLEDAITDARYDCLDMAKRDLEEALNNLNCLEKLYPNKSDIITPLITKLDGLIKSL